MLPCISEIITNNFSGLVSDDKEKCTLELTVPTGLEEVCNSFK